MRGNPCGLMNSPMIIGQGKSVANLEYKRKLLVELNHLKMLEENMWKQKSKILWLRDEDHNTSYFHKITFGKYHYACHGTFR